MGTRSRIGVMHGDKCKSIYCHWDGYLAHNGRMLLEYYDSAKANHLVALGDMSVLAPEIGEKHPFSPFYTKNDELSNEDNARIEAEIKEAYDAAQKAGWSTFYGRDRDETGTEFQVDEDFVSFLERCDNCYAEYYYIMRDGVWYCGTTYNSGELAGKLVPLAEALVHETAEA
jgi:hypothetical protein